MVLAALSLSGCALFRAPAPTPPAPPRSVAFDAAVIQSMLEMQSEYEAETMRCLTGWVVGDTIYVSGMTPSWIDFRSAWAVQFRPCTAPETVGWWHSHPEGVNEAGQSVSDCSMSEKDIETTQGLANFWIAVMTCDSFGTVVWRFKSDTRDHRHTFERGQFSPQGARVIAGTSRPNLCPAMSIPPTRRPH